MSLWDDLQSLVGSPSSLTDEGGQEGVIREKEGFNAEEDAKLVEKAIEGIGTDEKALVDILAHRSNAQRQLIRRAYEELTGRCLVKDLKGDTEGDFEGVMVALVLTPAQYDCHEVTRAMKGAGTKDDILIEIFASRSNKQIKALCDAYLEEHGRTLRHDLDPEVSGDFGYALLLLAEGKRDESKNVDMEQVKEDARALYEAGEGKWGTDERKFIDILCRKSVAHLRQTLVEYNDIAGKTLQKSIEKEMSGDIEELLVAVVKCIKSVPAYLAEKLHESMKGGGTDEPTLNRIVVSRSEIDEMDIRREYKKMYNRSLLSDIESDVSGVYGECLMIIAGDD